MSYGFGIIGLGVIADFHALAVRNTTKGKLVACYSRTQSKADAFGEKYGCKCYSDIEEFLSDPDLDIVTICTPSGAHMEYALQAAEARKHAIVEKPLEISLDRCDRIIEAFEKKRLQLGVVFQSRFFEASPVIKKALEQGRFGRLILGDAYIKWYRNQAYYDEGEWKGTWELAGGGTLMNQDIHAVDLLQWFMGPVDSVEAFIGTLGHERIEVEDVAAASLLFKNGALGVIEGSTAVYPGFLKRIEISGTGGSVVYEEQDVKVWEFADEKPEDAEIRERFRAKTGTGGGAADPTAIDVSGHTRQFEDFMAAIENGTKPLVDGHEGRKSVEIILAIYQSSNKGKRITLPL